MISQVLKTFVGFHIKSYVLRSFVNESSIISIQHITEDLKDNFVEDCILFLPYYGLLVAERYMIDKLTRYLEPNPEMYNLAITASQSEEGKVNTKKNLLPIPTPKHLVIYYSSRCVVLGVTYPLRTLMILLQTKEITFGDCKLYFNGTLPITDLYHGFGYYFIWRCCNSVLVSCIDRLAYRLRRIDTGEDNTSKLIAMAPICGILPLLFIVDTFHLYGLHSRLGLGMPNICLSNLLACMISEPHPN